MTHGHPSGIDLSCVPGDHVLRRCTDREALDNAARMIESEIKAVARMWLRASSATTHKMPATTAHYRAVYDGLNCAIGCIQREWERRGFAGSVLAIMPPTDGYDDNGDEHIGVADYCKILDADTPY